MAWLRVQATIETDGCQLWPFGLYDFGYGMIRHEGRARRAHHVAMLLAGREVPTKPLEVRHLCGVPACVNLRHLVVGTHAENEQDKILHGTSNRGSRHGSAKLTDDLVRTIRTAVGSQSAIAREFGITQSAVSMIRSRKRWSWLA